MCQVNLVPSLQQLFGIKTGGVRMHELSICQQIFSSLAETLTPNDFQNMREIHLSVGVLSGVEPMYLQGAFDIAAAAYHFDNLKLVIERKQIRVRCGNCETLFEVQQQRFLCPACGNNATEVVEGNELSVSHVLVETAETASEKAGSQSAQEY